MAEYPALPLWTDAYLGDTWHLSDAEHGRYFLMLMVMWRAPGQRFPNDDEWIARKFRRSVEDVQKELRPLIAEFFDCDGNWITQKRLKREWNHVDKTSKKRSASAKRRWNKDKSGTDAYANGVQKTESVHSVCKAPTPTPTPTPNISIIGQISEPSEPPNRSPSGSPSKQSKPEKSLADRNKPARRGERLDPNIEFADEWRAFAESEGIHDPQREFARFKDYWTGQAGQKGRKLDWFATWRNWCRNSRDYNRQRGSPPRRTGLGEALDDRLDEIRAEMENPQPRPKPPEKIDF